MESVTEEGVLIREQGIVPTGWASVLLLEPRLDTLRERGRRERGERGGGEREREERGRGGVNYYLAIHYVCMSFSSESHTKGNARHMALKGSHTMTKLGVCIYSTYIHRYYIHLSMEGMATHESTGVSGIHITHKKLMFNEDDVLRTVLATLLA